MNRDLKNTQTMKTLLVTWFGVLLSCVELHLASNDTGISTIPKIANVVNGSETNIPQVDILTTEVPVFAQDHSVNADTSEPQLNSQTIYDQPSSSSEHWNYDAISNVTVQCGLLPNTSRAATFLDIVRGFNDSISKMLPGDGGSFKNFMGGVKKVTCVPRNVSDAEGLPSVKIFNSSELLLHLGSRNSTSGRCTVVLFYAPWCVFSAEVAPHYNALARAFPKLDIVAIDAFHFSNLNSRFGTIAVPNVMIFHSAKAIARFNGSERTLASLTSFVSNVTGIQANLTVEVMEEDFIGPLQSEPSQETDYLLLLSWVFVIFCCAVGVGRSNAGLRVWNTLVAMGHHEQHHHQHID